MESYPKVVHAAPERRRAAPSCLTQKRSLAVTRGQEGTLLSRVRVDEDSGAEFDAIVAEGSRRMLAAALAAKVGAHVSSATHEGDELGHAWSSASGRPGRGSHHPGRTRSRCGPSGVDDRWVDDGNGERCASGARRSRLGPRQSPNVGVTLTKRHHREKDTGSTAPGHFPGTPTGGVVGWVFWNWHSIEWRVNEFGVRDERLAGLTR
jgi:hypothetical protein